MRIFQSTLNTRAILENSLKYIRSDVPTVITENEKQWLISNGITTVIDLRTDSEKAKKPCTLTDDSRFSYHTFTVTGGDTVPENPDDVSKSYIRMVDSGFNELIDFLLSAQRGVLYFCNAGKDRTGVVSAVLLHKLGASDEYIIADYLKSKSNLQATLTELASQNPLINIDVITPKRKYIEEFLNWYKGGSL